jgi:hypothetical protein
MKNLETMKNEITIVKSDSWTKTGLMEQDKILNDTIRDFIEDCEIIINVQLVEELGLKRFWIYTQRR